MFGGARGLGLGAAAPGPPPGDPPSSSSSHNSTEVSDGRSNGGHLFPHLAPFANPDTPDGATASEELPPVPDTPGGSADDTSSNPWEPPQQRTPEGSGPSTARGGPDTDDEEPTVAEAATLRARASFEALVAERERTEARAAFQSLVTDQERAWYQRQQEERMRALNQDLTAQCYNQSKASVGPPPRRAAPPTRPVELINAGKPIETQQVPQVPQFPQNQCHQMAPQQRD